MMAARTCGMRPSVLALAFGAPRRPTGDEHMNALRLRTLLTTAGVLAATAAHGQTYGVTVYARMSGSGAVGRVELAPAVDVPPAGAGAEDLPASAPTTPSIACATNAATNCAGQATAGSVVVLQPVSVNNAAFVSWAGCTSITPAGAGVPFPRCNLSMTAARTVTANFKVATFALTVKTYPALTPTYTPPYLGWLQAPTTPAIDCQTGNPAYPACSGRANNGDTVVVTAVPGPLSRVTNWSGCTSSTATTCSVLTTSDKTVSATFGAADVVITGGVQGSGTITAPLGGAVVDGMLCPGDCSASVTPGGSITFTATPGAGTQFYAWTGCASTTPTCTLANVTAPASVTATFTAATCAGCHAVPPPLPHPNAPECGNCHPGFTSTSVNTAVHMNGTVNVTCNSCHAFPPVAPHVQRSDCGSCHGVPYAGGVDPVLHQNGRVDPRHVDTYGDVCPGVDATPSCVQCHPCVTGSTQPAP